MEGIVMELRDMIPLSPACGAPLKRQRGVALFVALIMLVAMTLAALALVRSVDTSTLIAGNLAFKQSTVQSGDAGTEAAIAWLSLNLSGSTLDNNGNVGSGYYATYNNLLDLTGNGSDPAQTQRVDWNLDNCTGFGGPCVKPVTTPLADATGNRISYIVHRLCSELGSFNATTNRCATIQGAEGVSPKKGEISYTESARFTTPPVPAFLITTRVEGARNTVSFVQTTVHF